MTSEPDSTPRRRPPTIDLTAKEVDAAPGNSAQESGAAGQSKDGEGGGDRTRAGGVMPYVAGAVAGAITVAALVAGIWIAGLVPAREAPREAAAPRASAPSAIASNTPAVAPATDQISARLERIQEALKTPRADEAMVSRIAAAEGQTKALGDQLSTLTRRVDDVAAASQTALAQAKAAAAAAEGAKSAAQAVAQHSDLDALNNRIVALENAIKSLGAELTQRTSSADDRAARMAVAAEALRATVERGAPYQAELAAVKSFGAEQSALAPVAPFAAEGVPNAAALAREFTALMPSLLQESGTASRDGSFLGRLAAHAQNLVSITRVDAPEGNDAFAVVTRVNSEAARGDFAAVLADAARLPDRERSIADAWVKKVAAREAAIAASRRIAADALAALGKPVSQ
ncbi:MAG: hypothetical protein WBD95_15895 [Xanthobacteraceae bacterium]